MRKELHKRWMEGRRGNVQVARVGGVVAQRDAAVFDRRWSHLLGGAAADPRAAACVVLLLLRVAVTSAAAAAGV
jgi:hypothetical protein